MDWARREFIPSAGPLQRYSRFLEKIKRVLVTRGVAGALPWIKGVRSGYIRYLSCPLGSPQEVKHANWLVRVWGRRGAAVVLKKSPPVIRMVLTALTALRGFTLPVKVDVVPITGPSTASDFDSWLGYVLHF
jgi:hypothetical protein